MKTTKYTLTVTNATHPIPTITAHGLENLRNQLLNHWWEHNLDAKGWEDITEHDENPQDTYGNNPEDWPDTITNPPQLTIHRLIDFTATLCDCAKHHVHVTIN